MNRNTLEINESLIAGIDLDMVVAEYEALEKVIHSSIFYFTFHSFRRYRDSTDWSLLVIIN